MNISTVNELITSLESAGELSIKERKYLDLAKAYQLLAAENVGLALDNLALKQIVDSVTDLSNEPQYHAEGMGCGLEDCGITDRYDACRYGWDEAMERVYGEVIPCADELDFSATDAYLAGIKADGVEMFAAEQRGVAERLQKRNVAAASRSISFCLDSAEEAEVFAKQLREGAK